MGADRQRTSGYRILIGCSLLALAAIMAVSILAFADAAFLRSSPGGPLYEHRVADGLGVVDALYLSPGGDWLAVASTGTVAFWNVRDGEAAFGVQVPCDGQRAPGRYSAAFSPDGPLAVASNSSRIRLVTLGDEPAVVWEEVSGRYPLPSFRAEFAPDSKGFLLTDLYDSSRRRYSILDRANGSVEVLSSYIPGWDASPPPRHSKERQASGQWAPPQPTRHRSMSPSGELLGLTTRESIHIRERRSGESVLEIEGLPVDEFRSLHFIDDDIVLELGTRGEARVYSLASGEAIHSFATPASSQAWHAFSPDRQRIAILREEHRVEVRSTTTGEVVRAIESPRPLVPILALDHAGVRLATVTVGGIIEAWDVEAGVAAATLDAYSPPIESFLVQRGADWFFARGHRDGGIMLGTSSGRMSERFPARHLHRPDQPEAPVVALAASSDGRLLASADGGPAIRIWDTEAMALQVEVRGAEAATSVALHPEGRLLLANSGEAGALQLFDAATGEAVGDGPAAHTGAAAVAFCPTGLRAAAAFADGTVRLYDPGKLELEREILHGGNPVAALAFSPDGELVAASSAAQGGTTRIWIAATGGLVGEPATHTNIPANCVWLGFTSGGERLLGITSLGEALEMRPRSRGRTAAPSRHRMPARPVGGGAGALGLFCFAVENGQLHFLRAGESP